VNANANILYYKPPRGYQVDMTFDPTNTNANTVTSRGHQVDMTFDPTNTNANTIERQEVTK